ncbi:MAG: flagellar biosynthetic protein FliO [Myxococcales bacterium]|nr:flagellar biosynthetic protein FliO [Myxococcales bacterium]
MTALICALLLPAAVNARAPGVKTLTDVAITAHDDRVEFALTADAPLAPDVISARADGPVLMIRVDETRAERRWIDSDDRLVRRTLLHPSKADGPAAIVRSRFTRKIDPAILGDIRVRAEGDTLVVAVPRTAAIARRWAAADAAPAATAGTSTATTSTPAAPPRAAEPAPRPPPRPAADALTFAIPGADGEGEGEHEADELAAEPAAPIAAAPSPLAAAPALGEDAPLAPEPLAPDAAETPFAAGLTSPDAQGPGLAAFAVSLLFLAAVAFLMWRRMRGARDAHTGRPLIRPVGTHMLGPKQSLLLVDVAGEMVLLGTTDKGVQMLTKIEARDTDPHPRDARPAPVAAAPAAEPQGFAARLGGALARFRTAAGHLDPQAPRHRRRRRPRRALARLRRATPPRPTDRAARPPHRPRHRRATAAATARATRP